MGEKPLDAFRIALTDNESDNATGLIAIDESGDTGQKGSRYFLMAAIVTIRSRNYLRAYKATPSRDGPEIKFYNAKHEEHVEVLTEVACTANSDIVYVCIDKEDRSGPAERGNELYCKVLEELMSDAMSVATSKDLRIIVDESRFIKKDHLENMAKDLSKELGKNVKSCKKASSDKCVRIADYVVGAIRIKYENNDGELFTIIEKKISFAREPLGPR